MLQSQVGGATQEAARVFATFARRLVQTCSLTQLRPWQAIPGGTRGRQVNLEMEKLHHDVEDLQLQLKALSDGGYEWRFGYRRKLMEDASPRLT